jgi:hypothetical protein
MDIGMLWFDNDKQADLNVKVNRAVTYYKKKYGQKPNICFVNPSMISANGNGNGNSTSKLKGNVKTSSGVEIRESQSLLPNHFWIGINQKES